MSNEREVTLSRGQVEMSRGNKKKKIIFFKDFKSLDFFNSIKGTVRNGGIEEGEQEESFDT